MTRPKNPKPKPTDDDEQALIDAWLSDDPDDADADDYEIVETSKGPVTVRPITRDQHHKSINAKGGLKGQEAKFLAFGVVHPKMTAEQWAKAMGKRKTGDISDIVDKIMEISGMEEGATKAARAMFRGEPGE